MLAKADLEAIYKAIQERPDITIDEVIEKYELYVTNKGVRKAVIKIGLFIIRNSCEFENEKFI